MPFANAGVGKSVFLDPTVKPSPRNVASTLHAALLGQRELARQLWERAQEELTREERDEALRVYSRALQLAEKIEEIYIASRVVATLSEPMVTLEAPAGCRHNATGTADLCSRCVAALQGVRHG